MIKKLGRELDSVSVVAVSLIGTSCEHPNKTRGTVNNNKVMGLTDSISLPLSLGTGLPKQP